MQHSLPFPLQLLTSSLDMTDNVMINEGTSTFTGDGNFGVTIQHAPPSYLPTGTPRQLGLPPMPPIQYDASGLNMSGAEYHRSTVGFPTPATTALDLSNFGDDYRMEEMLM